MRVAVVAVAAFLCTFVHAHAQNYLTGLKLLQQCESRQVVDLQFCRGYLFGFIDRDTINSVIVSGTGKPLGRSMFCLDDGVGAEQFRYAYITYAKENPQWLHEHARVTALPALSHTFPCK